MTWRLWRLLTGGYTPPIASDDLDEARRKRLEAEYELRHTQGRSHAVNNTARAFEHATDVDEFSELIENAFAKTRRGRR